MRRTHTGSWQHSLKIIHASDLKKDEHFDKCIEKWSDPETCSDKRLQNLLCSAGGVTRCPKCEVYDCCRYGRELVRRHKCKEEKEAANG